MKNQKEDKEKEKSIFETNLILEIIPKFSWLLILIGLFYMFITFIQFGFKYFDLSQLVSNMAIGSGFIILAYVYWYFRYNDNRTEDISNDIRSMDMKLNNLENMLIELRNEK